jgi:hypothetical protein
MAAVAAASGSVPPANADSSAMADMRHRERVCPLKSVGAAAAVVPAVGDLRAIVDRNSSGLPIREILNQIVTGQNSGTSVQNIRSLRPIISRRVVRTFLTDELDRAHSR